LPKNEEEEEMEEELVEVRKPRKRKSAPIKSRAKLLSPRSFKNASTCFNELQSHQSTKTKKMKEVYSINNGKEENTYASEKGPTTIRTLEGESERASTACPPPLGTLHLI